MVVVGGEALAAAIEEELTCQVQFMLDRGHRPTHLNGHQYIEMLPVVGRVVESLLEKFRIPVVRVAWERSWWQSFTWPGISTSQWLIGGLKKVYAGRFRRQMLGNKVFFADVFFGTMTAGTTSLETIRAFLAAVRDFQLAEIGLHPGAAAGRGSQCGRWLARPAGAYAAARTGDGCLRRTGRTACGPRLPLGPAWPSRRSIGDFMASPDNQRNRAHEPACPRTGDRPLAGLGRRDRRKDLAESGKPQHLSALSRCVAGVVERRQRV